jgi:hypothetical protein
VPEVGDEPRAVAGFQAGVRDSCDCLRRNRRTSEASQRGFFHVVPGAMGGKPSDFTTLSRACQRLTLYSSAMSSMVSSSSMVVRKFAGGRRHVNMAKLSIELS